MSFLAKLRANDFKIILIYHAEAHADDTWPLGFGILQPNTLEERIGNCSDLLKNHPLLKTKLDGIFLDNMSNDFLNQTGSWPESYFFADSAGTALWKSKTGSNDQIDMTIRFAEE